MPLLNSGIKPMWERQALLPTLKSDAKEREEKKCTATVTRPNRSVTRPNRSRLLKPSETAPGFEAKLTQWPNHVNYANSHAAHRKAHILKAYNVKNAGFYWLSRHLHTSRKRFIHSDNFYKVHSKAIVPASVLANSNTRFLAGRTLLCAHSVGRAMWKLRGSSAPNSAAVFRLDRWDLVTAGG